jgi:hypothetical protein
MGEHQDTVESMSDALHLKPLLAPNELHIVDIDIPICLNPDVMMLLV